MFAAEIYIIIDFKKPKSPFDGEVNLSFKKLSLISSTKSFRVSLAANVEVELVSTSGVNKLKGRLIPVDQELQLPPDTPF